MPDLREFLQRTFQEKGGEMSFEDFMALALYDSEAGYYTTGIRDVGGGRGDFATSATLSDGLGRAIARWLLAEAAYHGWSNPVPLVELGGGNGDLAASVLRHLGWRHRRRVRYNLVEISLVLREKQRTRLARYAVSWHRDIRGALAECGGRALIFSNEFVDAFPAKWLRWDAAAGAWREVAVTFDPAAGLREVFRALEGGISAADYSAMVLGNPADGQRVEIQPSFRAWLGELALHWNAGSMLTIDYGGRAAEIYHRRPGGTLRGYFRHHRKEGGGVYERIGKQDLTLDVNFADLVEWGERLGFLTVDESSQREFLEHWGEGRDRTGTSAAGDAFRVLWQRRPD